MTTLFVGNRGVIMMIVMTLGGLFRGAQRPVAHLSYLSDTVLVLRYFEQGGAVRKSITAAKHRTGPHENLISELIFGDGGIRIGEPLAEFSGVLEQTPTCEGSSKTLFRTEEHEAGRPADDDRRPGDAQPA